MNEMQEHNTHTKGTNICEVLQLHNWKLPPMAHFPVRSFSLFWKTWLASELL